MQSRKRSLLESLANVIVGYGVATLSNLLLLPFFGVHISVAQSAAFGVPMTLISILRSYALRRLFNAWRDHHPVNVPMPRTDKRPHRWRGKRAPIFQNDDVIR